MKSLTDSMDTTVFLDAPNIGDLEKEYLIRAVDTNFVSTFGPYVSKFEKKFAEYVGSEIAVSLQSGTAAIHMALHELGIGEGNEVIVPSLTFVATINPVLYVRATPVIVDVDPETWNIDPEEIKKAITKNTKAIIPVHLYGNPCDMNAIMEIAKKHGLYVIEDATESLGATYSGNQTGIFGHFGCFSFNGNKVITTGGGGMIVTDEKRRAEHARFIVNQAKDPSNTNCHTEIGFNYRMTNIEAALGLAQMKKLDEFLQKKRTFNRIYRQELKSIRGIRFQKEYPGSESSCWLSCITVKRSANVDTIQRELKKKGVPTRRIFAPVVKFPLYKKYGKTDYRNSYHIHENGLCLPSSTLNTEDSACYVCKTLKEIILYGDTA